MYIYIYEETAILRPSRVLHLHVKPYVSQSAVDVLLYIYRYTMTSPMIVLRYNAHIVGRLRPPCLLVYAITAIS